MFSFIEKTEEDPDNQLFFSFLSLRKDTTTRSIIDFITAACTHDGGVGGGGIWHMTQQGAAVKTARKLTN